MTRLNKLYGHGFWYENLQCVEQGLVQQQGSNSLPLAALEICNSTPTNDRVP